MRKKFKPTFLLKNRHLQTLFSSLFRKSPTPSTEREIYYLDDGDFVECYWHNRAKIDSNTPIIVLFHGLAGSYKSPYIRGIMHESKKHNFATVLMHFRGCGTQENLKPRSYHSGDTADALSWITTLKKRFPNSKIFGVGYSLGGNMLLKLLGERGENSPLDGAVSVSAPMQLDISANQMNRGFSKLYQYILLKDLNLTLEKKFDNYDMESLLGLKKEEIKNLKTFWEFDGAYTAPIHGFTSAQDYYTKSSSKQFLKDIKTPTLIIHSKDDPFMTTEILPTNKELSQDIELLISEHGGHVGFVGGNLFKPKYWLESTIVNYFHSI